MATKRRKRAQLGEPPKCIPRPPILVAAFMAALSDAAHQQSAAEGFLMEMLSIIAQSRINPIGN